MSNTQERFNQRKQYLKQKRIAYAKGGIADLLIVPCAVLSVCLFLAALFCLYIGGIPLLVSPIVFVAALLIASLCILFADLARRRYEEAQQLPYVPPVTADTLPAEEVLVRASEKPKEEQSQILLRGTDSSAGTGEQELLRSSQGQE